MCEHRAEFAFASAGELTWGSTGPAFGFGLHHKYLRAIHLNVQVPNRRAGNGRKTELLGTLDIFLLSDLNILSNRFDGSLDRFSGNFQARQKSHLVPALSEGRHAANCREHAPHARREVRLIDVQFNVGGKLSRVAYGTQVIGSLCACPTHHGEYGPRTHSLISGDTTAGAGNAATVVIRW